MTGRANAAPVTTWVVFEVMMTSAPADWRTAGENPRAGTRRDAVTGSTVRATEEAFHAVTAAHGNVDASMASSGRRFDEFTLVEESIRRGPRRWTASGSRVVLRTSALHPGTWIGMTSAPC